MNDKKMNQDEMRMIVQPLPIEGPIDPTRIPLISPKKYLELARKQGLKSIGGYIIINPGNETDEFKSEVEVLESEETVDLLMLFGWVNDGFEIIGQSIDGDYLAATNSMVMIIPEDMHRTDIEYYDNMDVPNFLFKFLMGEITSKIFPPLGFKHPRGIEEE